MVGIKIDNKHSYDDYGLILSSKTIPAPSAKTKTVDIAGGDGVLDLTDFFGYTTFKNRTLTFEFSKVHQTQMEFIEDWSKILNELNEKKVRITLDEDTSFYYSGRISLSYKRDKVITKITMKVDADPYKLKWKNTEKSITGNGTLDLYNNRKKVVPTITTTKNTKVVFGNFEVNLNAGSHIVPEIELSAGSNIVTITSTGKTTFTYQEGGL